MKAVLTAFSFIAFAALLGVSIWATGHVSIAPALADLFGHPAAGFNPWFVATTFDAYFGFLWFWLWVAYKENSWMARIVWLLLILLGGNMSMAIYMLIQLWRLPPGAKIESLLLKK